jgi:murein DD-endopeptidase MepM/ murein hydrolase activator NlpD
MRRLAILVTIVVVVMLGLWASALLFLPDAAPRAERGAAPPPVASEPLPHGVVLAMPVKGMARETIQDSWGDPRDNGLRPHHGTDIMAPAGTPVLAAAPGRIEKLWNSAAGGITAYVRSPQRKWTYYYAHLSGYAPGLHEGQVVRTGDPLGYVGDTGNAGAGNYHLHFGLTRTLPEQKWYEGRDVDPYPYLAGKAASR